MTEDLPTRMYEAWITSPDDASTHASMKMVLDVARPEIEAPLRARIAELEAALEQSARVEASLASRIANLMDALEPFAEYAEQMADDVDRWSVATSDLRAARAALEKK